MCGDMTLSFGFVAMKFIINILLVCSVFLPLLKYKFIRTCTCFYIIQFIYVIAHVCYFDYFHNYLHLMQTFTLFKEGTKAITNLYFFLDMSFVLLFIDLPFFINLMRNKKYLNTQYIRFPFVISLIVSVSILCYFKLFAPSMLQSSSSPLSVVVSETDVVQKYGTLVNDIFAFCANLNEKDIIGKFSYGKSINVSNDTLRKNNIVILQLESIDSNVINKKYKGKYITPYLNALSKKCVYYPYTLSYHMGGGTSDAEFSIINSIEPLQSYPAMKLKSYEYPNSFLKNLNNDNYTCLAFHGNVARYFNRINAFPSMGFSKYYDIAKMKLRNKGWGASDEDVLDFTLDKLHKVEPPFLTYTITMSSHASFTNASHYYNNDLYDDIEDELVKNYFNSVSYVDMVLKDFITEVKKTFPNTYIFIWGDHTPAIKKPLYTQASFSFDGKYFEFVPLFIVTPDNKTYIETSSVASFLDIAPTILKASQASFSINTDGIDLLNPDNTLTHPIPFKHKFYSRTELYEKIVNAD